MEWCRLMRTKPNVGMEWVKLVSDLNPEAGDPD
jgi:hypothetical protein